MGDLSVLIVEDSKAEVARLERELGRLPERCIVSRATDPVSSVNQFRRHRPEVVLLDLSLNGHGPQQGLELIKHFQRIDPSARIIVLTGHTEEELGLSAIRNGAASFLVKPANGLALQTLVRDFAQTAKFKRHALARLSPQPIAGFIGSSAAMQSVYRMIEHCARTDSNVFLIGETGTGKELAAKAIHGMSGRSSGPLAIYFGSVPSTLADAELFGYVRGAFTGASPKGADGCLRRADGGTLFIDELDSLEPEVQRKLLRAIEEKTFKPLGCDDYHRSDFRLVTAAQPRIFDLVERGSFREDLLSRVEVLTIALPPLRERIEDIPELIEYFVRKASFDRTRILEEELRVRAFSERAILAMKKYRWPRNVRQLAHVVHHGMLQAQLRGAAEVDLADIEQRLVDGAPSSGADLRERSGRGWTLRESIERFERNLILESLERNDHSLSAVCQELGVGRTTLWRKIKQLRLSVADSSCAFLEGDGSHRGTIRP